MATRTVTARFHHKGELITSHADDVPGFATLEYYQRDPNAPGDEPTLERLITVYNQHHNILMQGKVRDARKVQMGIKKPTARVVKTENSVDVSGYFADRARAGLPVDKAMTPTSPTDQRPTHVKK